MPSTAAICHTAVVLGLPTIGILAAPAAGGDAQAWLTAAVQLFGSISAMLVGGAAVTEGVASLLGTKLQAYKTEPKKRMEEALESVRAAWVFSCLAAWPRMRAALGYPTAVVWTLAEAQPEAPDNLPLYLLKLAAVTLLVDAYMYFKHRALHSRLLFKFHVGHHEFDNPSPFGGFAVAPVEAFATFWPVALLCLPAAPVWGHAYALWVGGFVLLNFYLHCGYRVELLESLLPLVGLNSSAFHNVHHEKTVRNFGELCFIWDRMLGTGAHPASTTGGEEELAKKKAH